MDSVTLKAISLCVEKCLPFAAWRLPGKKTVHFGSAPLAEAEPDTSMPCFVMSKFGEPIERSYKLYLQFDANQTIERFANSPKRDCPAISISDTNRERYISKIEALIDVLKSRGEAKTVISKVWTEKADGFDSVEAFKHLLNACSDLFCHFSFHPDRGFWIGATPELMLKTDGSQFTTLALAGTKRLCEAWDEKNKKEQLIVANYIAEKLDSFDLEYCKDATVTLNFGKLCHLATFFHGNLGECKPDALIDLLNPTPALCGYPMEEAMKDISNCECQYRGCYGGCVGVIEDDKYEIFVNIRCIQFDNDTIACRTGGGIMPQSAAAMEWEETELKRKATMHLLTGN